MFRVENAFRVAENTDALLAFWDKDLQCKFANSSYMKWFGKSPQEMIDKITLPELLGDLYEINLPFITKALEGKLQVFQRDIKLPNGEIRSTIATFKPEIENDHVVGFYVHVADISELHDFGTKRNESSNKEVPALETLLTKVEHTLRASLFTKFPGINKLAAQHFISVTKLKHDFSKSYGSTIFAYYRLLQMQIAEKYIQEKIYTKSQVADILGFKNHSNFLKCYQKYLTHKGKLKVRRPTVGAVENSYESLYRNFVNESSLCIAMFDKNLTLLAVSPKWIENYSLQEKKILRKTVEKIFPKTATQWRSLLLSCVNGEVCKGEGLIKMEDGRQVWLRWEIKFWQNSEWQSGGILIFTEDITEVRENG